MKKLCQFISKYMGVLVFAAAVLAFVFPDTLSKIRPTVINYLLGVVMFGMAIFDVVYIDIKIMLQSI
ncbi:MAG: hypothetical protein J6W42_00620 [Bacteroidaceae bacterium]|nr:hypothetical protein [Bacteroidaceae bacterium]